MLDRQYIPLAIFAICLTLAIALAIFTGEWPTGLAIALAGCALALAMRAPQEEDHDTAFLEEDVAEIRAIGDRHTDDIALLRTSVDEVAEIVESLASDMRRVARSGGEAELEKLRGVVDALDQRIDALDVPREEAIARIEAIEHTLVNTRGARVQDEGALDLQSVEPMALAATGTSSRGAVQMPVESSIPPSAASVSASVAPPAPASITERAGRLRERFSRSRRAGPTVSTQPIFNVDRVAKGMLIDDAADTPSVDGAAACIRHALSLIEATPGTDSRFFVRIDEAVVTDPELVGALTPLLGAAGKAPSRMIVLVAQAAIKGGPPAPLSLLLQAGAQFGLERMTDWSVDLESLAKRGLAIIAVDGPAMARSAVSQKGDPTRLQQVLHARKIELLASEIKTSMQLDAVNSLLPDLLAGSGLGERTVTDITAGAMADAAE